MNVPDFATMTYAQQLDHIASLSQEQIIHVIGDLQAERDHFRQVVKEVDAYLNSRIDWDQCARVCRIVREAVAEAEMAKHEPEDIAGAYCRYCGLMRQFWSQQPVCVAPRGDDPHQDEESCQEPVG